MRKVDDRKKKRKEKKKEKKIMSFLVATNIVASRPPEGRPTGTPHARAKNHKSSAEVDIGGLYSNIIQLSLL